MVNLQTPFDGSKSSRMILFGKLSFSRFLNRSFIKVHQAICKFVFVDHMSPLINQKNLAHRLLILELS